MAELWVTTRTYIGSCSCPTKPIKHHGKNSLVYEVLHTERCIAGREQVITLGLKMADNDRLWQLWRS